MDHDDPISQFFPGEEDVDLYSVLGLEDYAKLEDIKKAYRRLALIYHPDKHMNGVDTARRDASVKFQQIGFAYSVLSDEKRKMRYDQTGKTDEGFDMAAGEDGWDAYFEQMFDRVTRGKLDEMKSSYQGSQEEVEDLKKAYLDCSGDIGEIMKHIPHSTHEDEARFIVIISGLVEKGQLETLPTWEKTSQDEKAKLVREKQGKKEAAEAEKLAKELGVWDEFFGSGQTGKRRGKGKASASQPAEEGDVSALQALILKKREKNMGGFLDNLAAKYGAGDPEPKPKRKGKKRANDEEEAEVDASPKKRSRKNNQAPPPPPDIDDAEFEKLQEKLFGDRASTDKASSRPEKSKRSRKAK